MKLGCLVVAAVLLSACAYKNPTTPTTTVQPRAGVPSRIELTANPGVGAEGGTGAISARVFDGLSTALADQTVTFTASEGALGAANVRTDDKGFARTNITGPEGATVSIVAAAGTVEQKTLIALQTRPGAPPPITPPVFPPPSPPPPPPPPTPTPPPLVPNYTVTLSTTPANPVAGNPITLNAAVTLIDGAAAPTSYAWDCTSDGAVDGTTGVSTFTGCSFPSAGTALVSVVVSNPGAGLSKLATLTITVAPVPAPVIAISCTVPATAPPTSCAASATVGGVPVPSSRITSVDWDWGDHTTSTTLTNVSTHPYTVGLTYELNATVTVLGNPATGTGHVTVKP
jgi:hypothetical protein